MNRATDLIPPPQADSQTAADMRAAVDLLVQGVSAIHGQIGRAVIGQKRAVSEVLCCVLADGHGLLEGVPGTGKTTLVSAVSSACGLDMGRIQFTPDLMPADITGTNVVTVDESGRHGTVFQSGPIFHEMVLADEINRATPRSQSAMLEAMEERSVTIAGETRSLPQPFIVLATQNPIEQEGTYRLPEAQLDRFMMKVEVPLPPAEVVKGIVQATTGQLGVEVQCAVAPGFLQSASSLCQRVVVGPHIDRWIAALVHATVTELGPLVTNPASPRAALAIRRAAQVVAMTSGRLSLSVADVLQVMPACLRHRLSPSPDGRAEGFSASDLIERLLDVVPTPAQEILHR
ncbi:MAG: AAA family ATPase [Phycisphaerales bacterium]|nr:AAA family ATPase [Phycisphaerales bacterium]